MAEGIKGSTKGTENRKSGCRDTFLQRPSPATVGSGSGASSAKKTAQCAVFSGSSARIALRWSVFSKNVPASPFQTGRQTPVKRAGRPAVGGQAKRGRKRSVPPRGITGVGPTKSRGGRRLVPRGIAGSSAFFQGTISSAFPGTGNSAAWERLLAWQQPFLFPVPCFLEQSSINQHYFTPPKYASACSSVRWKPSTRYSTSCFGRLAA